MQRVGLNEKGEWIFLVNQLNLMKMDYQLLNIINIEKMKEGPIKEEISNKCNEKDLIIEEEGKK